MRKFLIPLLAALALPTAVNATNYLECEAIYAALNRTMDLVIEEAPLLGYLDPSKAVEENEDIKRLKKDAKKRGCYYIQ